MLVLFVCVSLCWFCVCWCADYVRWVVAGFMSAGFVYVCLFDVSALARLFVRARFVISCCVRWFCLYVLFVLLLCLLVCWLCAFYLEVLCLLVLFMRVLI